MKYVTHHRFKELALCGERLNIPYGTELDTEGYSIVMPDGRAICYSTSENAKKHFSRLFPITYRIGPGNQMNF